MLSLPREFIPDAAPISTSIPRPNANALENDHKDLKRIVKILALDRGCDRTYSCRIVVNTSENTAMIQGSEPLSASFHPSESRDWNRTWAIDKSCSDDEPHQTQRQRVVINWDKVISCNSI